MSGKSSIEWCDSTWNPVVGCDHVSAGCDHCYAATLHNRRYLAWKRAVGYLVPSDVTCRVSARLPSRTIW